jgi:adenine deaminase
MKHPDLAALIPVARGDEPADLLLENARVVNVFTGEIEEANIAIAGGYIAGLGDYDKAKETTDLGGAYVTPGLLDAHMHMESSMLPPPQFARLAVPHGTTSVIIDPHEIANVMGAAGVRFMLDAARGVPLSVHVAVPSCVPATNMENAGATLTAADIAPLLKEEGVVSLGEMMNFPGVVFGVPEVLEKVEVGLTRRVDGHCPGLRGKALQAYIAAGISSDHESTVLEEAREKLRRGLKVFIREGTAAKNLEALLPLVTEANKHRFCFCTDDRHPQDIMSEGHIDHVIRKAIALGLDPVTAIQIGSHFTATHFGLTRTGALAPGYQADLVVLAGELRDFQVNAVYQAGRLVARRGQYLFDERLPAIEPPGRSVHLPADLSASSFAVDAPPAGSKIRVIGMQVHQLTTTERLEEPRVEAGKIVADVERDILKLAVIERHRATGNIGVGFVHGFGLQRGALASTVGHDAHNLIVLGTNDADMLLAARALEEAQGGQVVADRSVLAVLPLPIAGLMSERGADQLVAEQRALYEAYRTLGSPLEDPFMTLSFMPLAVIPKLKLTDVGLVDVDAFDFVPLVAEA